MTAILQLEEFKPTPFPSMRRHRDAPDQPRLTPEETEAQKVIAYDTGYQAGWEDSAQSHASEQDNIGSELAKNLQDLEFTFHEARIQVMRALSPLLSEIVHKVLPDLVVQSFGQMIIEELLPFAETALDLPIEIVVAPTNFQAVSDLLSSTTSHQACVVQEPTLGDGQALFRAGQLETKIDLDGALLRIGDAIQGIYELNAKELSHG